MDDPLTPLRNSPLWQAVAKLEWADEMFMHALALANEFVASGKFGIREESDQNGERLILFCERLPKGLPLAVGAGIHSLRSALDPAVSALMQGMTGKPAERVNFPFHETEREFRNEFKPRVSHCSKCGSRRETKSKLHDLDSNLPELTDLLLTVFTPWRDGNIDLWSQNKLDNYQKHRMLLRVTTATSGGVDYYGPNMKFSSFRNNEWIISPGTEVVIAASRNMIVETSSRRTDINFVFPKEVPYEGEPVFDVLTKLYKMVHSVLVELHSRFDGHQALL